MRLSSSSSSIAQANAQWQQKRFDDLLLNGTRVVFLATILFTSGFVLTASQQMLSNAIAFGALFLIYRAIPRFVLPRRGAIFSARLFLFANIIFINIFVYVSRNSTVATNSVVILILFLSIAGYLLNAQETRRIAIAVGITIAHIVISGIIVPYPQGSLPPLVITIINSLLTPVILITVAVINYRTASRAADAVQELEQQSAFLEDTVQKRTQQIIAAAEIGGAASALLNVDDVLASTLELMQKRFGYHHLSVFLLDANRQFAIIREATGEIGQQLKSNKQSFQIETSPAAVASAIQNNQLRILRNTEEESSFLKLAQVSGSHAQAAIPLMVGNRIIGALDIHSENENDFTPADITLLQTLSNQIAIAIDNANLFTQQQHLIRENEQLLSSSQKAVAELNTLASRLSREGWQNYVAQRLDLEAESGNSITRNAETALTDALEKNKFVQNESNEESSLAAPIILRGQTIGALAIEKSGDENWSDDDLALAQEVADRLALAVDNARLLDEVNKERERLSFLFESSQTLASTLNLQPIINTILGFAKRLGGEHSYLFLIEGETTPTYRYYSTQPGREHFTESETQSFVRIMVTEGLEGWVLENRRIALVKDTLTDDRWYKNVSEESPIRSVVSIPLLAQGGAVTGILAYTHSQPNRFSEEQMPLFDSIRTQAYVALQNARLYRQVSTQQRNANILAESTQKMAQTLNERDLMQVLIDSLFEGFKPNSAILYRWNPEEDTLTPITANIATKETDPYPVIDKKFPAHQRRDLVEIMTSQFGRIQKIRDESDDQVRESMALPFIFNDQVEGVVEVIHTGEKPGLNQSDLAMFQSLLTSTTYALQTVRLYQQLSETAERLREVDRLKSQFLANMSHELRTPLNSIIGFSRVIMKGIDGPVTDIQVQDLAAINSAGQHLLGMINDILDLSKIEAGKMELAFDKVDLPEIIKGVMSTMTGLTKDKPVRLIPDVQPDLPPVYVDSIRIRQVLINLLSNAAKFTDEGSITVRARIQDTRNNGARPLILITVHDTGHGMAAEDLPKLFQAFSQVDGSATRKSGGTGLGLAICRTLVELHGGTIWVESELNKGTTFYFTLPVYQPEPALPTVNAGDTRRIILAVDDDARVIDLYRRYAETKGFAVHGITSGQQAIEATIALKPHVILLDVVMQEPNGWQVLQDLKRHEQTKTIPIIICSILNEREKALSLGAIDCLVKPILDIDLYKVLEKLEQGKRAAVPAPIY